MDIERILMDLDEARFIGVEAPEPTLNVDIEDQVEPWGWHHKLIPRRIRRRLELYREFIEGLASGDQ